MPSLSVYEILINAALRFVSFRPRSEKELRQFLERKMKKQNTYAAPLLSRAIERMRELGYVDDYKFAAWWVEQRRLHRPKGQMLVVSEIVAHGVPKDVAQAAYADSGQTPEELMGQASAMLQKKWSLWQKYPVLEQKKKAYDHLRRRGFSMDVVASVVDGYLKKR
jgi:regulatory protein